MEQVEINQEKLEKAAELLRAVAHQLRLKIIKLINEKREVNVNIIYNTLKIEQSITSQHLKILRGVGIVNTRREGKKIFYSLNYEKFAAINKGIELFESFNQVRKTTRKKK